MNNTALRAEVRSTNNTHMVFANEEHEKFYYEMTCPRQHRHLKRKDSIRFSVLLVFSNFYIYTSCRKGTRSQLPHPRKDLFKSGQAAFKSVWCIR